jgi:tripartite-type tricarboxylate transporter receptor subunit TctC
MNHRRQRRRRAVVLRLLLPIVGLLAAACGGAEQAAGTGGSSCYQDQTLTFVVSYGPGGGYDAIARMVAPYLEKDLGATIVVENQDGAGGLIAANQVYTAEPDGLTIGFFSGQGLIGSVLGSSAGASFDPEEFTYVGRIAKDPRVLTVGAGSGFTTIEDIRSGKPVRFASAGPGGSENIDATVLFPVLGINGELITGYKGSAETELAVTSGATAATSGTLGTRLAPLKSGDHLPVLVIGRERVEELPDTPALLELELAADKRALAEAHTQLQDVGRAVLAPPGVPQDCATELENAFAAAASNPELLKQLDEADQDVDFLGGEELKQLVQSVLNAPAEYKELLEGAYQGQ